MKHPLHVSVTNIDYNQSKKTFEISVKLFLNDLQTAVEIKNGRKINLTNNIIANKQDIINEINDYFSEYFILEINNQKIKTINFEFGEKKINEESIWMFYKFQFTQKIKTLKLVNSIFTDLYSDQTNLVIITINDKQKGFNLSKKNNIAVFEF